MRKRNLPGFGLRKIFDRSPVHETEDQAAPGAFTCVDIRLDVLAPLPLARIGINGIVGDNPDGKSVLKRKDQRRGGVTVQDPGRIQRGNGVPLPLLLKVPGMIVGHGNGVHAAFFQYSGIGRFPSEPVRLHHGVFRIGKGSLQIHHGEIIRLKDLPDPGERIRVVFSGH